MKRQNLSLLALALCLAARAQVVTYPAPAGATLAADFEVAVRTPGGEWQAVDTYAVRVCAKDGEKSYVEQSSMATFSMGGAAEVRVRSLRQPVERAAVRPLSRGIVPAVEGDELRFTLERPENLSVEVNGDIHHNLQLFANPLEQLPAGLPEKDLRVVRSRRPGRYESRSLVYFGPGHYRIDSVQAQAGQTVYVAGGAVVDGEIHVDDAERVRVCGRGFVYPQRAIGIYVRRSRDVEVEGLVTTQCAVGGSRHVTVDNVKVISSYGWGDGFNVFASSDVSYDRVFARTSDDCTTVYATRKGFAGSARRIRMTRSVLWADVAHPIFIGLHGNAEHPDTIADVCYRDIDILDEHEAQIDYQGCMAINAGDNNLVRDITFDSIRVEDFRRGQLLSLRVAWNQKYCKAPGAGIENVTFSNIDYKGSRSELSQIYGYNEERKIRGVHFKNFVVNGRPIHDGMDGKPAWFKTADMARVFIGEHVEDVTFEP